MEQTTNEKEVELMLGNIRSRAMRKKTMEDILIQLGFEDLQRGRFQPELPEKMAASECLFNANDNAIDLHKARLEFYKHWPFEDTTLDMVRHNGRIHFGMLTHQ